MALESTKDFFYALKIRDFRLFIIGKLMFTLALQMQGTIVSLQIYDLTHDKLALGFIGGAEAIPAILIALYGGWVADHFNRRKILIISLSVLTTLTAILLLISNESYEIITTHGTLPIYIIIFLTGISRAFLGPAQFALLPQTLPNKDYYKNAISWNSSIWQTSMVLGPAIAAIIYTHLGVQTAYSIDLILLALSVASFWIMSHKELPKSTVGISVMDSLKEGLKFVAQKQEIIWAMSLDMFAVLFGGAVAMMPFFSDEILGRGTEGVGYLRAAPAVGSVVMMLIFTYYPIKKRAGLKMLLAIVGFSISMMCFAYSKNYLLSIILLAIGGGFDAVSVIIRQTLLQTLTPENMKGRVSSVSNIFVGSSNEIGEVESGIAAEYLGVQRSVFYGACVSVLVVVITYLKAKKLRDLEL